MDELTESQIEEMKDVFTVIDTNKSGSIDCAELGKGLRGLGLNPSNAEVQALMDEYDKDNNSVLSLEEFAELYHKCLAFQRPSEEQLIEQFNKLDVNGDGTIDANELKKVLLFGDEALTEEEAERIIADFDRNGDGVLSLNEFVDGILGRN